MVFRPETTLGDTAAAYRCGEAKRTGWKWRRRKSEGVAAPAGSHAHEFTRFCYCCHHQASTGIILFYSLLLPNGDKVYRDHSNVDTPEPLTMKVVYLNTFEEDWIKRPKIAQDGLPCRCVRWMSFCPSM